jgi:myo-inositol-1(or 4)-monophosphatase
MVAMTSEQDPAGLRETAVRVAREAAAEAARMRAAGLERVRTKSSETDVVTEADTATERLIRNRLAELRPGEPILGEEGGLAGAGGSGPAPDELCWVVDPIDGTVNYLYGLPWYAVSVAVTRGGPAGRTLAGAVVEPDSGRVWSAHLGGGATLDGRPLRAAPVTRLDLALVATGFSYTEQRRVAQGELSAALLARVRDVRRLGAASLDLCAVAAGWVDGYYEHAINPWDWAAGALVATEAGAVVRTPDPDAPYGDAIVAAAPGIADALVDALVELRADRVPGRVSTAPRRPA